VLAMAMFADAGVLPAAVDRPLYYDRLIAHDDLAGRTLRELELMRAAVLYRLGRPVPIVKGWLHYYLPTYLPGGYRALWKDKAAAGVPSPVDRQNAAFLSAYEKELPPSELEGRLDAMVARHRYAGPPRRDEYRFRAFSFDGRSALFANRSSAMLVEVPTGAPIAQWNIDKGAIAPELSKVPFFKQSGSEPPADVLEKDGGAKLVARLTENGRLHRHLLLSPDGLRLLAGPATRDDPETGESRDEDPNIVVVDLRSKRTILRVHAQDACYWCYRFLPDGRRLIVAELGVVTVWDLDSAKPLWHAPQPPGPTYPGAPDFLLVEPASNGKSVFVNSALIDADTGRLRKTLPLGLLPTGAVFSPDSERILVAGTGEGDVMSAHDSPSIWDAKRGVKLTALSITNVELAQLDGALAWTPDGRSVLVVGVRGPMLFDAKSGHAIAAFEGHERWWDFDEQVEAWLLSRRLGRQIPALGKVDFQVEF
jgi:hypothetical protein